MFSGQQAPKRSKVYFDVSADGVPLGRINMELFNEVVPRTAENFRQIATGEAGFSYTGSKFHRVIPNFMLQVHAKWGIMFVKYIFFREEILSEEMEPEVTQSMVASLRMRTFNSITPLLGFFPWPMLDLTQMDPSFS